MVRAAEHEAALTAYALPRLMAIPGLRVYGDSDPANAANRLGVISLAMEGIPHFLLAAILSYEFGIGVRTAVSVPTRTCCISSAFRMSARS